MKNISRQLLIILLCTMLATMARAQVPQGIQNQVNNLDEQIASSLAASNKTDAATFYNKAAYLLWNHGAFTEALKYFEKALELSKNMNNHNAVKQIEISMGLIYSDMEKYNQAVPHLEEGLRLTRQYKNARAIASAITNLATAYLQIGKYNKSIELLNEAVTLAGEENDLKLLRRCYGILYENYDKTGDSEEAYKYFELYSSLDHEVKKVEMQEVKTKAEEEVKIAHDEKKATEEVLNVTTNILRQTEDSLMIAEKLTREQRLEIQLKEAELREEQAKTRARNQLLSFAGMALLITLIFLLIVFKQKNTLSKQKQQIERQNKNIKASIRYAQTIQNAILPPQKISTEIFDSFVMFRPKDIVSGDFYWYTKFTDENTKKELELISVIDCTGHGVPGAFMSMIGSRLLDEIVNERKVTDPAIILDQLDNEVMHALRQNETDNNDGMDLGICVFEKNNDASIKLTYAGAKRPLYYVFNKTNEIGRLKGTRKSIGGTGRNREKLAFKNSELNISSGDMLYLFSDGIVDQNDAQRKRFGSQKLEETLLNIHHLNINKQNDNINEVLNDFIQNEEQRDDITVMGIKVK